MAEKMTLERIKPTHWMDGLGRVCTAEFMASEKAHGDYQRAYCIPCVKQGRKFVRIDDAHLTPPAQAVDVDSLYEVIRGFGYTTRGQSDEIAEAVFEHITTRALAGEKAEGSVVVGYCHRYGAERLMDRKDQPKHTFTAIEVWNKRSDFYRIPVLLTLPTPPTDGEE